MILAVVMGGGRLSWAGGPPAAPASQIYDPDLLLAPAVTANLSRQLKDFQAKSEVAIYLAVYTPRRD